MPPDWLTQADEDVLGNRSDDVLDDELDDVLEDELDDVLDDSDEILYLKYRFDGVATLAQLADDLIDLAVTFEDKAAEGWTLAHPVDSGWVCLVPPGA